MGQLGGKGKAKKKAKLKKKIGPNKKFHFCPGETMDQGVCPRSRRGSEFRFLSVSTPCRAESARTHTAVISREKKSSLWRGGIVKSTPLSTKLLPLLLYRVLQGFAVRFSNLKRLQKLLFLPIT